MEQRVLQRQKSSTMFGCTARTHAALAAQIKPEASLLTAPVGAAEAVPGGSYSGGFSIGKFSGAGTFTFPHGSPYRSLKGQFESGLAHGPGVLEYRDGGKLSGTFHDGRARGDFKLT
jgi:hypothetical protein